VPEEVLVVWRASKPIATLLPVRMVMTADGTLRLSLSEGPHSVELRAEVAGGAVASDMGFAPRVELPVRAGSVVLARIRTAGTPDTYLTLTTELLVTGQNRPR
jgi:hypothetical protein